MKPRGRQNEKKRNKIKSMMIGPCDTAIKYNKTLHTVMWTTMAGYYSPLYTHYKDVCVSVYILSFYISTGAFYISITPLFVHGNWRSRGKLDVAQRVNWPLIIVARPETQFRALYMFAERRIINTKLMSFRYTCPRVGTWRVGRGGGVDRLAKATRWRPALGRFTTINTRRREMMMMPVLWCDPSPLSCALKGGALLYVAGQTLLLVSHTDRVCCCYHGYATCTS